MKKILFDILYYSQTLRLFPAFYFHYELRKYVKKGDVVIDIGANWGIYTRLFSRWAKIVYAIEPIPKFYGMLKRKNVIVLGTALGNKYGDSKMCQWRSSSGAYKISEDGNIPVCMAKGSEVFKSLDKINFIKIDVESFTEDEGELPIIKDMQDLIRKHKPMILVETGFIDKILEILDYKIIDQCLADYLIEPNN